MKLVQSLDLEHGYYDLARETLGHFIVSFFYIKYFSISSNELIINWVLYFFQFAFYKAIIIS